MEHQTFLWSRFFKQAVRQPTMTISFYGQYKVMGSAFTMRVRRQDWIIFVLTDNATKYLSAFRFGNIEPCGFLINGFPLIIDDRILFILVFISITLSLLNRNFNRLQIFYIGTISIQYFIFSNGNFHFTGFPFIKFE